MTDRNLEEAIFQLQKLNTENGVKKLVEEAAQLFAGGRQIEASALMEKAEAIMAAKSSKAPAINHIPSIPVNHQEKPKVEERAKVDEQVMTNMAGRLADGLSKILTGAFEELERHIVGESRKISTSFEQQLERLHATVDSLTQLKIKFEQLAETVSEQRAAGTAVIQKYDQLSASVIGMEESVARHEKEVGALRGEATSLRAETGALRGETTALRNEAKDLSTVVVHQIDGLSARIGLSQEELTGLKTTVSDISRKVAGFIERIDRQGEVIRALNDTQVRRAAALDELLGVLTRLKAPAEPLVAAAAAAGQL
jgi:chromosome segregation ATPase